MDNGPHHIRLCGLRRWKAGGKNASGSQLRLEQFLHLRALVKRHSPGDLEIREFVQGKYADAADNFLKSWPDFHEYITQVSENDPALDVDGLGLFAGAKLVQNQVLLDAYLGTSQDGADSFEDSTLETPLKKVKHGVNFNSSPPGGDAADEQIVNEALISFASALTRKWMVQQTPAAVYDPEQTPTKGGSVTQAHNWKTVADWTMARGRFHIRERMRDDDPIQASHMADLRADKQRKDNIIPLADNHSYGHVLTSDTDGSLYRIGADATEILAIVETKKRLRKNNRLKIEWQEAAEILGWLNQRLRTERTESEQHGSKGKGRPIERRGMLQPKSGRSGEKYR